jgi:hypothetical protein
MNFAEEKLFFIHIPKTAGTSVRRVLRPRYTDDEFVPVYSHEPSELQKIRNRLDDARVLYGHFSHGFHELLDTRGRYATMLREPIARVWSFYRHQLHNPRASYHAMVHSGMPLDDLLEGNNIHELNNHMTRIVSGHVGLEFVDDDSLLTRAIENIERDFLFVGLVDRMAESMASLSRILGWRSIPDPPFVNVGSEAADSRIDPLVRQAIERFNRLDLALYRWVANLEDRD